MFVGHIYPWIPHAWLWMVQYPRSLWFLILDSSLATTNEANQMFLLFVAVFYYQALWTTSSQCTLVDVSLWQSFWRRKVEQTLDWLHGQSWTAWYYNGWSHSQRIKLLGCLRWGDGPQYFKGMKLFRIRTAVHKGWVKEPKQIWNISKSGLPRLTICMELGARYICQTKSLERPIKTLICTRLIFLIYTLYKHKCLHQKRAILATKVRSSV